MNSKIYADFDDLGFARGFYSDDIFPDVVVYGEAPEPTEEDPRPNAPEISRTRNPLIPEAAVLIELEDRDRIVSAPGHWRFDGETVVAYERPVLPPQPPESVTLGDWRVALTLWGRLDNLIERVVDLSRSSDPSVAAMGRVAYQRLEYSNTVMISELMQLRSAFGFTEDEVVESMWRAQQVSLGDLSGVWPLENAD